MLNSLNYARQHHERHLAELFDFLRLPSVSTDPAYAAPTAETAAWLAERLTTAAEAGATIERFLGLEVTTRLSQAALEVLAIVAYLQPATRPQIDQLRGVNSDGALRSLLSKGLVEEVGRLEKPGRPILYGTTPDFLQAFGLDSVAQMPRLAEDEEE